MKKIFFTALAVVVVIVSLVTYLWMQRTNSIPRLRNYNPKVFSTVFLDNQQVYFGRILSETEDTLVLDDVYYLNNSIQQSFQATLAEAATGSAKLSLIQRGDELHGPRNPMVINRDHVLFYEEMKETSEIMDAISANESQQ